MTGVIATLPKSQFSNALGLPMSGGTLTSYLAGTTTPVATYQDEALSAANTNPIALDSRGECTLWLDSTKTYKFVLKNALGVVQWTVDNITNSTAFAKALDAALRADISSPSGASMVGYLPLGTGAVPANVQTKLSESVSVKDFGAVGDGTHDDLPAFITALLNTNIVVPPGNYYVSDGINAIAGSNKTIVFLAGVTIVSGQSASPIFNFTGVADGFRIEGNGAVLKYATAPTVRTTHTVAITGDTITNLEIEGLDIQNSANMGIAVFCGPLGGVATGSKNISIHDCKVSNTLGDGVHVENADSDVRIYNIYGFNNHDDVVAVINYTGSSGAPTHPSPTFNVLIDNIQSRQAHTSTVSLAGVQNFVVNNINEHCAYLASCFTVKMTHADGYAVGNINGVIDNITSFDAAKVIVLDTPTGGTAINQNISIGKVVAFGVSDIAVSLSNSGTYSDNKLKNISIGDLQISGDGGPAAGAVYISNASNCNIENLWAQQAPKGVFITNASAISWKSIRMNAFPVTATPAMVVVVCQSLVCGDLVIDGGNCATGLQFQSNSGVTHSGYWKVTNAVNNYLFGSNSDVIGSFYSYSNSFLLPGGSVTINSPYTITYDKSVPAGANFHISYYISVASGAPTSSGSILVASPTNENATFLFSDVTSGSTYVNYRIDMFAA